MTPGDAAQHAGHDRGGHGHDGHKHLSGASDAPGPAGDDAPDRPGRGLLAKVLTASDGVVHGTREDRSGAALVERLRGAGFEVAEHRAVADGVESVGGALADMTRRFSGLVVTTGGTGFGPRDLTPEATRTVLEREAPGLAEAMRLAAPRGLGRLSRGIAGTVGRTLVLNTPGSPAGAVESLEAVLDVLPHALRLLADEPTAH
jgi:molybdenum cofactor synthesis domain-containing protein